MPQRTQSLRSFVLLLLALAAVLVPWLLPDRRLVLDSRAGGTSAFLMPDLAIDGQSRIGWDSAAPYAFHCRFADASRPAGPCSFNIGLGDRRYVQGVDLSVYDRLRLDLRYTGPARYLRVFVRSFDPRFSVTTDGNSSKFNALILRVADLGLPLSLGLGEFTVPDWWTSQFNLPHELSLPDLSNATVIGIDVPEAAAGTEHRIEVRRLEFVGRWVNAEHWYLGIVCVWLLAGLLYLMRLLIKLRRAQGLQHRRIQSLVDNNTRLQSEKYRLQLLSTVDSLTRVANRHGIERMLEQLHKDAVPAAVILIDVDHFKAVNDLHGHDVGDRCLQAVARLLATNVRESDHLARWGGEEFMLVCPHLPVDAAMGLAEKLRRLLDQTPLSLPDTLHVTASFGVAHLAAGAEFAEVYRMADQALYLAKSGGRNRVVLAGPAAAQPAASLG